MSAHTAASSEGATTGSAVAQRPDPPRRNLLPNGERVLAETELTDKHRLVAQYMVFGCDHQSLLTRIPADAAGRRPAPGEPLTLIEAAMVTRIRRRLARHLHAQPAFQRLIAKQTHHLRNSYKPKAVHRIGSLIDEPGAGKAADHKVNLDAAKTIIGEDKGPGVQVNIQNNVAQVPGYVIRLSGRDQPRVDKEDEE